MAETKRTNTQYVFPVNARFAQGFAWVAQGPTLARERVGCVSYSLRQIPHPRVPNRNIFKDLGDGALPAVAIYCHELHLLG